MGVTPADRVRLRDYIVQREGATPAAAAAVAGSAQATSLMQGARPKHADPCSSSVSSAQLHLHLRGPERACTHLAHLHTPQPCSPAPAHHRGGRGGGHAAEGARGSVQPPRGHAHGRSDGAAPIHPPAAPAHACCPTPPSLLIAHLIARPTLPVQPRRCPLRCAYRIVHFHAARPRTGVAGAGPGPPDLPGSIPFGRAPGPYLIARPAAPAPPSAPRLITDSLAAIATVRYLLSGSACRRRAFHANRLDSAARARPRST